METRSSSRKQCPQSKWSGAAVILFLAIKFWMDRAVWVGTFSFLRIFFSIGTVGCLCNIAERHFGLEGKFLIPNPMAIRNVATMLLTFDRSNLSGFC